VRGYGTLRRTPERRGGSSPRPHTDPEALHRYELEYIATRYCETCLGTALRGHAREFGGALVVRLPSTARARRDQRWRRRSPEGRASNIGSRACPFHGTAAG